MLPRLEQAAVSVSAVPTHGGGVRRHVSSLDALCSSAAAHHQAALICSGEALLALRCAA